MENPFILIVMWKNYTNPVCPNLMFCETLDEAKEEANAVLAKYVTSERVYVMERTGRYTSEERYVAIRP